MVHSNNATSLVIASEGDKLKAYQDGNGIWTIGYGHTGSFAAPGTTITEAQAVTLLNGDLAITDHALARLVKVTVNQNQWDALESFVFNIGQGHFGSSTCLAKLNAGDTTGAAAHILDWNKVAGQVSKGLDTRRHKEQALFCEAA